MTDILIKHFWHTGHSNWVLLDRDQNLLGSGSTRKLAEQLALRKAAEGGVDSVTVEYWYAKKKQTKTIFTSKQEESN